MGEAADGMARKSTVLMHTSQHHRPSVIAASMGEAADGTAHKAVVLMRT